MNNFLYEIIQNRKAEIQHEKSAFPLKNISAAGRAHPDFFSVFKKTPYALIGEIKKASPSKGVLCDDFIPSRIAGEYIACGIDAISVLTEKKYFQGSVSYLNEISVFSSVPLLCKDFIIDEYQIIDACSRGAAAVLLIGEILSEQQLKEYIVLAGKCNLGYITEAHSGQVIEKCLSAGSVCVGINNRDLESFKTNLNTTAELARLIPSGTLVISESGINTAQDIRFITDRVKVHGFLIGETLMKSADRAAKISELQNA